MSRNAVAGSALCAEGDWIAVQVRFNRERFVTQQLEMHGYTPFLPIAAAPPSPTGRVRETPLIPGYVFCRYRIYPDFRIVQAHGVMRLVGLPGSPVAIPDEEVDAIRRVVESGASAEPWKYIRAGDRVRVCAGALSGLEGVLVHVKNSVRVIVSVTMLQRSVAVELDADTIRPLGSDSDRRPYAYSVRSA